MPEVIVIHSDNIEDAFSYSPLPYSSRWLMEERDSFVEEVKKEFKLRGLSESELAEVDVTKHMIVLPRKYQKHRVKLCGVEWHEFGHVAAHVLGLDSRILNESFATANQFKGLLETGRKGRFGRDEVVKEIERNLQDTAAEKAKAKMSLKLKGMGLKVSDDHTLALHDSALFLLKKHNPNLRFRDRDADEVLAELNMSIKYILGFSNSKKEWKLWLSMSSIFAIVAAIVFFKLFG